MAKEMDLIKYKNRVDKHQGLYYMLNSSNIPTACSVLVGLGGMTFLNNPSNSFFYSTLVLFNSILLYQRYRYFKKSGVNVTGSRLYDKVVKSEEYFECDELYKKYIKSVAEFLRIFEFSSSKELLVFMEILLQTGIFSQNFEHNYHNYKIYHEYVTKLMGATVFTGASVCRHMASLFNDILAEYGTTSAFLVVRTSDKESAREVLDEDVQRFMHAVVGIEDGDNKYLYDAVEGEFVSSTGEVTEDLNSMIGRAHKYGGGSDSYYVLAKKQLAFHAKNVDTLKKIVDLPFATIDDDEIAYFEKQSEVKFMINAGLVRDFYFEKLPEVRRLAELAMKINPASDEELTEWTLTKCRKRKK